MDALLLLLGAVDNRLYIWCFV